MRSLPVRVLFLGRFVGFGLLLLGVMVSVASAVDWTYSGTGDWTNAANWSGSQPNSGDKVNIFNGGTAIIDSDVGTIQRFELAGPSGTTSGFLKILDGGSLTTNNTGNTYVGARGLGELTIEPGATLTIGPGSFYVGWRGVGAEDGDGTVIQNGGNVSMGKNIDLAQNDVNTIGRYEIHGGSLSLTNTNAGYLQIGRQGTGIFTQTDGIVTISRGLGSDPNTVMVGSQGSSTGLYDLSGGELRLPNGTLCVGYSGTAQGTFNQSGGIVTANTTNRDVFLGHGSSAKGAYNLSGTGVLNSDDLYIGLDGTGLFNQTGGTLNTRTVILARKGGSQGDYSLTAGEINASGNISVGIEGIGSFTQTSGTVQGPKAIVGENATGTGQLALSGDAQFSTSEMIIGNSGTGTLLVDDTAELATTGFLFVSKASGSNATFIQNGGDVVVGTALRMATDNANTSARYEIHGGSVTVAQYLQVGRLGEGTLLQTGGTITVNRPNDNTLTLGDKAGGKGTFVTTGGTVNVTAADLTVGAAGIGMLDVRGSNTDIDTVNYKQNDLSTFRSAIDSGGASIVDVSGTATITAGALLDVDVYGGVILTAGDSFDLLKTATAGNISGTLTVTDEDSLWTVTQDGSVVNATLAGPSEGSFSASYLLPNEMHINGGAGSNSGWIDFDSLKLGEPVMISLDLVNALGDLDAATLGDLKDFIEESGINVSTSEPGLNTYDLTLEFFPDVSTGHLIWDFSDFDPNLMVTGLSTGVVPEPSSFVLFAMAMAGFGAFRVSRKRKRQSIAT